MTSSTVSFAGYTFASDKAVLPARMWWRERRSCCSLMKPTETCSSCAAQVAMTSRRSADGFEAERTTVSAPWIVSPIPPYD